MDRLRTRTRNSQPGTRPQLPVRRPVLRSARRLSARRTRNRAAQPRRRAGVPRADPATHQGHPAAVSDHRHARQSRRRGHHRDRARRTRAKGRHPGHLLPVRDRRRQLALFSVVRPAATRACDRLGRAVRVPAGRRRPRGGLGGVGARPRGTHRNVGRTLRARLSRPRRPTRRAELQAAGSVAGRADRALGLLRRRTRQRMGRRNERLLRPRPEHRRRGARIARRRPRPHVPPAQRHLHVRAACARRRRTRATSIPTSTGSSRSTPPKRARCCCSGCTA